MDDKTIIRLYLQRDEQAIEKTQTKYGAYCYRIAKNILSVSEDAEECVNDAWAAAWNTIPPTIPVSLKAFLGKIIRDISINRYLRDHAQKRYNGMQVILDELEECIPSAFDVQQKLEQQELSELINAWLGTLSHVDAVLFVKRYYFGDPVKELAKLQNCTENQMAQKMMKLRNSLKKFLISRGITP